MKKIIVIFNIVFSILFLAGCSNDANKIREPLTNNLRTDYGLEVINVTVKKGLITIEVENLQKVIDEIKRKSSEMSLEYNDPENTVVAFFESIWIEVESISPDLKLVSLIYENSNYFFDSGLFRKVMKDDEIFMKNSHDYTKSSNYSSGKSKQDYYDMNPNDENWKIVVNALSELYGSED